jgi:oxygen-dependent protoporphyrinogen oxidase
MVTKIGESVSNFIFNTLENGFIWEEGPNTFQPTEAILRLAKDTGSLNELVLADGKLPRYVYWNGQLHSLPSSLTSFISTKLLSCEKC